jgi:hypothetical protein
MGAGLGGQLSTSSRTWLPVHRTHIPPGIPALQGPNCSVDGRLLPHLTAILIMDIRVTHFLILYWTSLLESTGKRIKRVCAYWCGSFQLGPSHDRVWNFFFVFVCRIICIGLTFLLPCMLLNLEGCFTL